MSNLPPTAAASGLILDWGGVLTTDLDAAMRAWAVAEELDLPHFADLMNAWLGQQTPLEAFVSPVHALERGEIEVFDFEHRLAAGLSERSGRRVSPEGLVARLFEQLRAAPDMTGLVRRARGFGIKTALLSNSWGNSYPEHLLDGLFDVVVISGSVGMRKPEDRIYLHTTEQLGLIPSDCVFVDDMERNVVAAVNLGMIGVHHLDYERTAGELEAVFGVALRS